MSLSVSDALHRDKVSNDIMMASDSSKSMIVVLLDLSSVSIKLTIRSSCIGFVTTYVFLVAPLTGLPSTLLLKCHCCCCLLYFWVSPFAVWCASQISIRPNSVCLVYAVPRPYCQWVWWHLLSYVCKWHSVVLFLWSDSADYLDTLHDY